MCAEPELVREMVCFVAKGMWYVFCMRCAFKLCVVCVVYAVIFVCCVNLRVCVRCALCVLVVPVCGVRSICALCVLCSRAYYAAEFCVLQ